MPSASSAKSAKASSVPPADQKPAIMSNNSTKSAVSVTGSPVAINSNSNNSVSSISSCASNAATGGGGAAASGSAAVVATVAGGSAVPLASIAAGNTATTATPASTSTNIAAAENHSSSSGVSTPIKQILVIIEHKIRNLEKRKTKLESYRAIQASGKELSADQKQAVSKYDEVIQCLDFARDLTKQMLQLQTNAEKEQKKQARREAILRSQAEASKIREVLVIQNILLEFTEDAVREDFLNGTNGAVKLEENDLNILEKFYFDIGVKRQESPEDTPFLTSAQKAAEVLSFTIDGRPKQYGDTTYESVRKIFQTIQDCGYFDQAGKVETPEEENVAEEEVAEGQDEDNAMDLNAGEQDSSVEMVTGEMIQMHISQGQQPIAAHVEVAQFEAPSAAAVPAPAFPQPAPLLSQPPPVQPPNLLSTVGMPPPQAQLQRPVIVPPVVPAAAGVPGGIVGQQPPPPAGQVPIPVPPAGAAGQIHAAHFPPTTVRAVEQGYYKQHQYLQQMRPLADVIGSTNFFFLQESELDSPDMIPPSGFTPTEGQTTNPVIMNTTALPPQSPSNVQQSLIQQQPQMPLAQPGMPHKSQPVPASTIPSQTFTNQSFPPIVPPQAAAIFSPAAGQNPELAGSQQPQQPPQMPPVVYPPPQQPGVPGVPGVIPMQGLVPPQQVVVSQQQVQSQMLNSMADGQSVADVISQQAAANIVNLMGGPAGANVPLPGFPPSKFQQPPPNAAIVGVHPVSVSQIPVKDTLDALQQQSQQQPNEKKQHDDLKDARTPKNDTSQDWDEPHVQQKSHTQSLASRQDEESNQWSNDVANTSNSSSKHDWNSNYDNQNDSNTWKNISNDNYGGRNTGGGRNSFPGGNRAGGGGGGAGRGSGLRGNNAGGGGSGGGPPSNGYRGRSNNYQQQQNNRNAGMYFRNSDNYYPNQNGNTGGYGNKDSSSNYVGGGANNNYRPRGGPVPPNNRQQSGARLGGPPNNPGGPSQSQSARNNAGGGAGPYPNRPSNMGGGSMSTNPNTRPGRNPGSAYGSSRPPPPNNVRQQQDINA